MRGLFDATEKGEEVSADTPGLESLISHVFHPTDFSKEGELAFAHALRIAVLARAELTLFHVERDGEDVHWSDFPHVRQTLERWGMLAPGSRRDDVVALGMDVEKIRAPAGDPVKSILGYLREDPAELIVLASHAATGFERLSAGAVAAPVARRARSATLFLPAGVRGFVSLADGSVSLQRVLVPIDSAPDPQSAVSLALRLARALGATPQLTLLHVGPSAQQPRVHVAHDMRERVERRSVEGGVVETIGGLARELDADLVVMTTRGRHGFLDALRGSTTERVLRHAGCALLAIPEQ